MVKDILNTLITTANQYQPAKVWLGSQSRTAVFGQRPAAPFAGGTAP